MIGRRNHILFVALLVCIGAYPVTALCETYRWNDADGRVFYGEKPPANAVDVTKIKAPHLSRYSSKKLISRLGARTEQLREEKKAAEAAAADTTLEIDDVAPVAPAAPRTDRPAKLEHGKISLTLDDVQRFTAVKTDIRNTGDLVATGVLVSFEFEDGTIVPGRGPDTIGAKSRAMYFVAPEQLPIRITPKSRTGKLARPKVVVQFTEDETG